MRSTSGRFVQLGVRPRVQLHERRHSRLSARRSAVVLAAIVLGSIAAVIVVVHPDAPVVGAQGAVLDGPRWSFPSALGPDAPDVVPTEADLIVDASDGAHAVWIGRRPSGDGDEVFHATRPAGGVWGSPSMVAGWDGTRRADPVIAIDARGGLHVAVAEIDARGRPSIEHYHRRPPPNTAWSAATQVDAHGGERAATPAIAGDRLGNIHVVWTDERRLDSDVSYRRRRGDGGWDEIQSVHDPRSGDQRDPDLGMTRDGAIWAVWEDTRSGRSEIWASVLPLASPVWWPDYPLTVAGRSGPARTGRIAGDGAGGVHAVWLEDDGHAIARSTRPEGAEVWLAPQTVYRPDRGVMLEVDLAGGGAGQVLVAWSETRPEGSRVYSGVLAVDGALLQSRVDRVPRFEAGHRPRLGLDSDALGHVLWSGLDVGRAVVLHATAELPAPEREWVEVRGRLRFEPRVEACHGERYAIEDCSGEIVRFAQASGIELAPLLGRDVVIEGRLVKDSPCEYVLADRAALEIGACRGTAASVTGIVLHEGVPVEGARVGADSARVLTGPSGRFFLDGLAPGTHSLTATLPCALSNIAPSINVNPRQTLRMEPAHLWAGDVVEDCLIDVRDLTRVASHYRTRGAEIGRCTDIDGDGVVGAFDLALVADRRSMACAADWRVEDPIFAAHAAVEVFSDLFKRGPAIFGRQRTLELESASAARGDPGQENVSDRDR